VDAGDETDLDVTSVAHGGVFVGRIGDPAEVAEAAFYGAASGPFTFI